MLEDIKIAAARVVADVVRDAVGNNPAITAGALKTLAEAAAEAIAAGVAKLSATT